MLWALVPLVWTRLWRSAAWVLAHCAVVAATLAGRAGCVGLSHRIVDALRCFILRNIPLANIPPWLHDHCLRGADLESDYLVLAAQYPGSSPTGSRSVTFGIHCPSTQLSAAADGRSDSRLLLQQRLIWVLHSARASKIVLHDPPTGIVARLHGGLGMDCGHSDATGWEGHMTGDEGGGMLFSVQSTSHEGTTDVWAGKSHSREDTAGFLEEFAREEHASRIH